MNFFASEQQNLFLQHMFHVRINWETFKLCFNAIMQYAAKKSKKHRKRKLRVEMWLVTPRSRSLKLFYVSDDSSLPIGSLILCHHQVFFQFCFT